MPIVTVRELANRMSGPDWTAEVRADAERLLATLTATLASRLSTHIEPGPARVERAAVSEQGIIVTAHPVHDVLTIDGVAARSPTDPDTAVVPPGWRLVDNRVRRADLAGSVSGRFPSPAAYASRYEPGRGLAGMLELPALRAEQETVPTVIIDYRPGWGAAQALRGAILTKATAIMLKRHGDSITSRGMDAQDPPAAPETWSAVEITELSAYRSIAGPEWTRW